MRVSHVVYLPGGHAQGETPSRAIPTIVRCTSMMDQEKVQAAYHDGILELHLPKLETAIPKRIAITG
jgi:HSP20 family molecular chaperone IbpA